MRPPTQDEITEETRQAAIENRLPDFSRYFAAESAPAPDEGDGVLCLADILKASETEGEPYQVPGLGKKLFIFGVTEEDFRLMLSWSLGADVPPEEEKATPAQQMIRAQISAAEMELFQVILCCRSGPNRHTSTRIFKRQDAAKLKQCLGYGIIREIVRRSNEKSGGDEHLGPGVRRFFGLCLTSLQTWLSASSTWAACPDGLRVGTERLESLVSRALSRGTLDSGTLSDLDGI